MRASADDVFASYLDGVGRGVAIGWSVVAESCDLDRHIDHLGSSPDPTDPVCARDLRVGSL